MFLFKVDDRFMITGRGLVLTPGIQNKMAKVGDQIKIITPDNKSIETTIRGLSLDEFRSVYIGNNFSKEDVPIGSEVWLNKKYSLL